MTIRMPRQRPLRLRDSRKNEVRTQFGALCWRRREGKVEILLVTSRGRKRWIIPKGWPVDRATPAAAAETEAWEEAGASGKVSPVCLGIYSYDKEFSGDERVPCVVAVFPLKVSNVRDTYPERKERKRKWVRQKKAAKMVNEPELAALIAGFDPGVT